MSSSGTRKCYHCGQGGHMAKDCSQAPKEGKVGPSKQAAAPVAPVAATPAAPAQSGTRKCYHCGQGGHMAKDCSQAPKDGKVGAAKKPAKDAEEKSFKERLAEYKATNPQPGKKNFCYLCGKEGHRERDCPKNSKKQEDRTCLRCGEPDHIARVCPTIANRTVYRQETKDRAKGCYICSEEGHHAEECPQLDVLAEEFPKFVSKLQSGMKLNVKVYNVLLERCARALELNGALFLYNQMIERSVAPNDDTMRHLEYVHDRSGRDQSKLKEIPMLKKRVHLLKEIVSAHRHARKTEQVTDGVVTHLVAFLRASPANLTAAQACGSLFDLAKHLKGQTIPGLAEPLSSASARVALATLKALGRYHQKGKSCEFDLGADGTDITTQGKFFKSPEEKAKAEAAAKKKSKSSSKKKRKAKSDSEDADGDATMESEEEPAATKKKSSTKEESKPKKRKSESPAAADATETKSVEKKRKTKA